MVMMIMKVGKLEVHRMDVMDFLDTCKESGIVADAIITDPPYNISSDIVITRKRCADINLNFGSWDFFESESHFLEWTFEWVDKCDAITRPGGIFISFFDNNKINFLSKYLVDVLHYKLKNFFIYVKKNPAPQFRGVKWQNGWEEAGIWQKPSGYDDKKETYEYKHLTFNKELGQHPDYLVTGIISGKERSEATIERKITARNDKEDKNTGGETVKKIRHPTQKPVEVLQLLLEYWTKAGDIIVDPFCGVGSLPVACERLYGRNWIANDKSKKWTYIAKKRINKVSGFKKLDGFF